MDRSRREKHSSYKVERINNTRRVEAQWKQLGSEILTNDNCCCLATPESARQILDSKDVLRNVYLEEDFWPSG